MKFYPTDRNPTYGNPQTLSRENARFEVMPLGENKSAFTNRRPRRDSKYWKGDFLIWDLTHNEEAKSN